MTRKVADKDPIDETIDDIHSRVGQSKHSQWYAAHLDSIGPHASPSQRANFDLAVAYLEYPHKVPNGEPTVMDRESVLKTLKGIDFHSDVKITRLETNDRIHQFNEDKIGSSFTKSGVDQSRLGISRGNEPSKRQHIVQPVANTVPALESRAAPIIDTWTKSRTTRDTSTRDATLEKHYEKSDGLTTGPVTDQAALARGRVIKEEHGRQVQTSGEYCQAGGPQYFIPAVYRQGDGWAQNVERVPKGTQPENRQSSFRETEPTSHSTAAAKVAAPQVEAPTQKRSVHRR